MKVPSRLLIKKTPDVFHIDLQILQINIKLIKVVKSELCILRYK